MGKQHIFVLLTVGLACLLCYLVSQTPLGKLPKYHSEASQPLSSSASGRQWSEWEKEEAKKTAISFCENYVNYDSNHPNAYLIQIRPFTEDKYYQDLLGSSQPHPGEKAVKVLDAKAYPVDDSSTSEQKWNVIIKEQTIFMDEKQKPITDSISFFVTLVQDQYWKVKGVERDEFYSGE